MIDKSILDNLIIGRVEPHIYAFTTNTIPNYLKVGDTYRPVAVRLREWQDHFPELEKQYEHTARVSDGVYFRDFAVHQFLETDKKKVRLLPTDIAADIYYSREFFKDTEKTDVKDAVADIEKDYLEKTNKYQFYNAESRLPETYTYPRTETYELRPNQRKTVAAFHEARANGHKNLLMYAVMRFGKSFTAMCCALDMSARLVVVVSGKADVKREWQKTVQSHVKFADYDFATSDDLIRNNHVITETLAAGKRVVVFLTLQDLQGDTIKDKHQEVFGQDIDLLLVDETHFGARADKYGAVLNIKNYQPDVKRKYDDEDFVDTEEADAIIKVLKADTTIHLSGTPYRILMGSEFKKEDIIAFYQFTDIIADKEAWDKEHVLDDKYKEWDNPYYGFPQMVRFAFHPSERARKRLEELKKAGTTYAFSALLKPKSIKKDGAGKHKEFEYESEVLDLFEVIDGSKEDENLLGFLDYDKIKDGKMCRHIVIVLPYCASCDALEALIKSNAEKFRNLREYEIINISGVEKPNAYNSPDDIKNAIRNCEAKGKKTITLTVNRMLTGSTVPEWDTMIYLKDTASPQEYDQAIFRLQNQYIKTFVDENGDTIKFNMKPQTLLVDFDPSRMFVMQETKSQIYNVNVDAGGNAELEKRIREELRISPIVTLNADKIVEVKAFDILKVVSDYQKDKGIREEAIETPADLSILEDEEIRKAIERENEIGAKAGLSAPAHEGKNEGDEGDDFKFPDGSENAEDTDSPATVSTGSPKTEDEQKKLENSLKKKIQSYYVRILLFAYLTKDRVISVSDIIANIDAGDNRRIAKNLGLSKDVLSRLFDKCNKFVLRKLDYKIQDLNDLSLASEMLPAERASVAMSKFGKLGDAIVITPANICDDMVALLPDEFMRETANKGGRILDIAGTAGEYAVALHKRLSALGVETEKIANMIFTIPKSSVCYELIRKLYEMLGLNVENIASEFVAADLLEVKTDDKIDYDKIKRLLTQNKPFNTIKLADDLSQGGTNMMTFDAVVGNPPYQENMDATSDNPVYHYFYDIGYVLSGVASFISPARFLFNAGKTPKEWNTKILNDEHFMVARYEQDSAKVFPDTDIKGGIAITYRNVTKDFGKIQFFTVYKELAGILAKTKKIDATSFSTIIYAPESYKLSRNLHSDYPNIANRLSNGHMFDVTTNIFEKLPEIFLENEPHDKENYIQIVGLFKKKRTYRWIKRQYISNHENLEKYKVFVPKSNGSGAIGEILSTPLIGEPLIGHTQTFISIGAFDTLYEATAVLKYVKSKFARTLLGTLKVTQDNKKEAWLNVPMQDFTPQSDIDWSKSVTKIDEEAKKQYGLNINEIDAQLYKKYALTPDEISFIESMIKPME